MLRTRVMSLATLIVLTAAATIAAQTSTAANLTGTWTGGFVIQGPGGPVNETMHMVAKHTGVDFTGTAGPNPDRQWPIAKGKVTTTKEGVTVTFEVQGDDPLIQFELKLVDGHLKGTAKAEQGGQKLSAVVDVQRGK